MNTFKYQNNICFVLFCFFVLINKEDTPKKFIANKKLTDVNEGKRIRKQKNRAKLNTRKRY